MPAEQCDCAHPHGHSEGSVTTYVTYFKGFAFFDPVIAFFSYSKDK